jgi:hypothetical protein
MPSKRAKRHANPHHYSLQALSLRTNTVYIHGTPVLPVADVEVYYDIEGFPDDGFEYLIGAAVARNGRVECHAFWASDRAEQATAFSRFVELVAGLPGCKLFHFGRYDTDALRRVREDLDPDRRERIDRILADSINVLAVIHAHVYFPVYSNSLKEVASFLGYQWSDADASGLLSMMWREMWELSHDPSLQERLIRYNREDCLALKHVCNFVRSAVIRATGPELPDPHMPGGPTVAATKDILRRTRKWVEYKRPTFALDEFAHASNSAYFDYQRERVIARTDKQVARICKRNRRRSKSARVNQQIVVAVGRCGHCGSAEIRAGRKVRRRVLDLRFSTSGVKRWVVEYVSSTDPLMPPISSAATSMVPASTCSSSPKSWTSFVLHRIAPCDCNASAVPSRSSRCCSPRVNDPSISPTRARFPGILSASPKPVSRAFAHTNENGRSVSDNKCPADLVRGRLPSALRGQRFFNVRPEERQPSHPRTPSQGCQVEVSRELG